MTATHTKKRKTHKVIWGLRIEKDLLARLSVLAAAEDRTCSDYVRLQLRKLAERGAE